jgi:XRE family transcriptional regulator, aerobic/anaerobic benzoate catabolism transcriptional regulator
MGSGNMLHDGVPGNAPADAPGNPPSPLEAGVGAHRPSARGAGIKHPVLVAVGERVRERRERRGLSRKALAHAASVSERHLANLEYGVGNASILILLQLSEALDCPIGELVGDTHGGSAEWARLRELLAHRGEATLQRVRAVVAEMLGAGPGAARSRVALVGLRGAGKSTLGRMLARDLGFPFVELTREVERVAGCGVSEIQALYGQDAYRRYERRALEETLRLYPEAVLATPGGLVSDAVSYRTLLDRCTTVWLQARPEDHMSRVVAQGDLRPIAASAEAMGDLKAILANRSGEYAKAGLSLDTSARPLDATFAELRRMVRESLGLEA